MIIVGSIYLLSYSVLRGLHSEFSVVAHEFNAKQCNSTFRQGPYPLYISLRFLVKIRSFPFLRGWGRVRSDGWGSSSCLVNWTLTGHA